MWFIDICGNHWQLVPVPITATRPHQSVLQAPFCDPEYHPVTLDGEPSHVLRGGGLHLPFCY